MEHEKTCLKNSIIIPLLLLGLIFVCYGNTLQAPWYFDDFLRIVNNSAIHWKALSPSEILKSAFYHDGLHRPLAMISFGLNWYLSGDDVTAYHVVNLLIHFMTALVLFKTIQHLLAASKKAFHSPEKIQFVALTATVLWALHPIQTQAVTYIVQRSTILAALFFITAVYLYIAARQTGNYRQRIACAVGVALCYFLALAAKVNTILLPASLWLVEIIFFQNLDAFETRQKVLRRTLAIGAILSAGCFGLLWIWKGNPLNFFTHFYQTRPFTLSERLLTEPRVILFYLSQILWPLPGRFSLVHEVSLSTSLWQPWSTIPALIGVLGLLGAGLAAIRKFPLTALAILFFFINHLIESTIIPLELVFEHRNYLPTMFLFVPMAAVMQKGIDACREGQCYRRGIITAGTVLIMVALGAATHSRNSLWNDKRIFWEHVMVKAPHTARPYLQLAAYHESRRNFPLALKLYRHSLNLSDPAPRRARALALTNMGVLFKKMNQNGLAREHFLRALDIFPKHEIARYNLVSSLLIEGDYEQAMEHAELLMDLNPKHPYYLNAAGLIRLQMGAPEAARPFFEQSLTQKPDDLNTVTNLGVALGRLGRHDAAAQMLERAVRLAPQNPLPRLCLIDLSLKTGKTGAAGDHTRELIARVPLGIIDSLLVPKGNEPPLYDKKTIGPFISDYISGLEVDEAINRRLPSPGVKPSQVGFFPGPGK